MCQKQPAVTGLEKILVQHMLSKDNVFHHSNTIFSDNQLKKNSSVKFNELHTGQF